MKLTPVMERFILHWGEMGSRWGVSRTVAQVHALLYLSPDPLNAEQIVQALGVARSNVSQCLKELHTWRLIDTTHVLGDRRDHFVAHKDNWLILRTIVEERKKREIDPTTRALLECVSTMKPVKDKKEHEVNERIKGMLEFLTELTNWYEQVSALPQQQLIRLIRAGGKISRWL